MYRPRRAGGWRGWQKQQVKFRRSNPHGRRVQRRLVQSWEPSWLVRGGFWTAEGGWRLGWCCTLGLGSQVKRFLVHSHQVNTYCILEECCELQKAVKGFWSQGANVDWLVRDRQSEKAGEEKTGGRESIQGDLAVAPHGEDEPKMGENNRTRKHLETPWRTNWKKQ